MPYWVVCGLLRMFLKCQRHISIGILSLETAHTDPRHVWAWLGSYAKPVTNRNMSIDFQQQG